MGGKINQLSSFALKKEAIFPAEWRQEESRTLSSEQRLKTKSFLETGKKMHLPGKGKATGA